MPREALPAVLERVGYTAKPVGAVMVQDPDELGLKGYPRSRVDCTIHVADAGGERTTARVTRWLVQLGFGAQVQKVTTGAAVTVNLHMVKMVAKCSTKHGWNMGPQPAAILVHFLETHGFDKGGMDSFVTRLDGTSTFLLHASLVTKAERISGTAGIFFKVHKDETSRGEKELVWLPEGTALDTALDMAKDDTARGLAEKGTGRLAVRFDDVAAAAAFARTHNLEDSTAIARWKISGVPQAAGAHGLYELLVAQGWKVTDIVYMDPTHAIFYAENRGEVDMHYVDQGQSVPIHVKAVNARARELAKETAQAERARAQEAPTKRNLMFYFAQAAAAEPKAEPKGAGLKRPASGHTGATPDQKAAAKAAAAKAKADPTQAPAPGAMETDGTG